MRKLLSLGRFNGPSRKVRTLRHLRRGGTSQAAVIASGSIASIVREHDQIAVLNYARARSERAQDVDRLAFTAKEGVHHRRITVARSRDVDAQVGDGAEDL